MRKKYVVVVLFFALALALAVRRTEIMLHIRGGGLKFHATHAKIVAPDATFGLHRQLLAHGYDRLRVRSSTHSKGTANPHRYPKDAVGRARWTVDVVFGRFLPGLHLDDRALTKLKILLGERYLSSIDARQTAIDSGLSGPDIQIAIRDAQSQVQAEINQMLPPDAEAKLALVEENPGAARLACSIAPAANAGAAANADTLFALTGAITSVSDQFGSQQVLLTAGIDPSTGLSVGDKLILTAMAAYLAPAEQNELRQNLVSKTLKYPKSSANTSIVSQ